MSSLRISFFWKQDFLHSKNLIHGNIKARSVLVTQMLTAKLWGLGDVYMKKTYGYNYKNSPGQKKWQAPEILANRGASQKSDMYVTSLFSVVKRVFGIALLIGKLIANC